MRQGEEEEEEGQIMEEEKKEAGRCAMGWVGINEDVDNREEWVLMRTRFRIQKQIRKWVWIRMGVRPCRQVPSRCRCVYHAKRYRYGDGG